jgi:hypothetical protein
MLSICGFYFLFSNKLILGCETVKLTKIITCDR